EHLQHSQLQGKLKSNPKASALVDEIARTLNTKKDVPTLESFFRPNVTDSPLVPKTNKKKKKKRKRPSESTGPAPSPDLVSCQSVLTREKTVLENGPTSDEKVSRSKRRRLQKKLKATNAQEDGKNDPSSSQLTKVAQKRPCPESPVGNDAVNESTVKRQRTTEVLVERSSISKNDTDVPALLPAETSTDEEIHWDLEDPIALGKREFEVIIAPLSTEDFFKKYFEKHPLRVQRNSSHYNDWLSTRDIDLMLRKQRVMFGEHLDLASYEGGRRYTLNPPGRAFRSVVWDHYKMGCSVRLLCPQLFLPQVRYRLSLLQEYFGCFVGANVYLTPPGSQGFAPHYDDIEAFIMQLEGSKEWRIYAPRSPSEKLPRESSPNFTEKDLGKPMMTVTLKPGDLLYLPRGFIHQGSTSDETHSLHLTISTYQKHTWGDFLSKLIPIALQSAMETDVEFREGLPIGFLRHVGGFSASMDTPSTKKNKQEATKCEEELRHGVVQRLRHLADRIENSSRTGKLPLRGADLESESPDPLLVASDQMAVDLISQSLPPQLRADELCCHVQKQGERWTRRRAPADPKSPNPSGVVDCVELEPDTEIRLVRWSAFRVMRTRISSESNKIDVDATDANESGDQEEPDILVAMYHSLDNTNVYKEYDLKELALELKLLPAVDCLAKAFPDFVAIEDLPLATIEEKMEVAIGLYDAGLVVTRYPLEAKDSCDEETEDERSNDDSGDIDSNLEDSESVNEEVTSDEYESLERVDVDECNDDDGDNEDESVGNTDDQSGSDEDEDEVQLDDSDDEEDSEEYDDDGFDPFSEIHAISEEESSDSSSNTSPKANALPTIAKTETTSGPVKQKKPRKKRNRKPKKHVNR
ncbi:Lysine-specific demethylase NO66, partial [Fasciolopsis buskii]